MNLPSLAARAISALDPGRLVTEAIADFDAERVSVLALGKAAEAMAVAAREALGDRLHEEVVAGLDWGSHPIPGVGSMAAGQALLAVAESAAAANSHLLALVSGGGSALAIAPARSLTLADVQQTNEAMWRAGLTIDAINTVRKHISALKGGQLAAAAAPAPVTTWIVSDVVSGDLATVASGPTLADPTTFADAQRIASGLALPRAVRDHIAAGVRGDVEDTPTAVDGEVRCLADNRQLVATAAELVGDAAVTLDDPLVGDVAAVTNRLCEAIDGASTGAVLVAGGEPTVSVPAGTTAESGRAHHLALALAIACAGRAFDALVIGSDGVDGRSGGAGARVSGTTVAEMAAAGIDAGAALADFNAADALRAAGASLPEAPTGNNLADLVLIAVG